MSALNGLSPGTKNATGVGSLSCGQLSASYRSSVEYMWASSK